MHVLIRFGYLTAFFRDFARQSEVATMILTPPKVSTWPFLGDLSK